MAKRFYILPKIGDGTGGMLNPANPPADNVGPYRAKYVWSLGVPYGAMDYGKEMTMLVGAEVTTEQHQAINANVDVTAIPANLDNSITSTALATVSAKLESLKIPADWMTTATTYRQALGVTGRIFQVLQRFDGMFNKTFFESSIGLDTRVNELTATQRNAIQNAATSFGLDTSFVTGPMLMREVLKRWADSMPPFTLMGETF